MSSDKTRTRPWTTVTEPCNASRSIFGWVQIGAAWRFMKIRLERESRKVVGAMMHMHATVPVSVEGMDLVSEFQGILTDQH